MADSADHYMKIVFFGGESKNWDTLSRVIRIYNWQVILINRKAKLFNLQQCTEI